jgi:glycine/D-amino acid oxidase-like deaminating enzyme
MVELGAKEFDLVVVGAGIIGLTTAFAYQQKYPKRFVAVIEKNTVGSGATQYTAALDLPLARTTHHRDLMGRNALFFNTLSDVLPTEEFQSRLEVYVVSKTDLNNIEKLIYPSAESITGAELEKLRAGFPFISIPNDAHVARAQSRVFKHNALLNFYTASLLNMGARILEGFEACHIFSDSIGLVLAGQGHGTTLRAKSVAVCTGPWMTNQLVAPALLSESVKKLRIKKVVSFLIQHETIATAGLPVFYFQDLDAFYLPMTESTGLISIRSQIWDVDPEGPPKVSDEDYAVLEVSLSTIFSNSFRISVIDTRVFCDAYSGGPPFVEFSPLDKRLCFIGGGSGSGVRLAGGLADTYLSNV